LGVTSTLFIALSFTLYTYTHERANKCNLHIPFLCVSESERGHKNNFIWPCCLQWQAMAFVVLYLLILKPKR
jgi:hypothetical protein